MNFYQKCVECKNKNAIRMCKQCNECQCLQCYRDLHSKGPLKAHQYFNIFYTCQEFYEDIPDPEEIYSKLEKIERDAIKEIQAHFRTNKIDLFDFLKMWDSDDKGFLSLEEFEQALERPILRLDEEIKSNLLSISKNKIAENKKINYSELVKYLNI